MGNSKSHHQKGVSTPSFPGEWVSVGRTDYCQLVKNIRTGVTAQQYHIPLDQKISQDQNLEIYEQRRIQNDNLVVVYHVEKEINQYICQGKEFLKVMVERIPYRLSEMNNLPFLQSLYILREAIVGYSAITDYYGPISISDEMIGFTSDHRIKVWLNEEFAHNLPQQNINFLLREPAQIERKLPNTITQLFSVVEQHCENGQFPEQFSKAYRQYPLQTFSEALQFIQDYANKKGINLKNSLPSHSMVSVKTDFSNKEHREKKYSIVPSHQTALVSALTVLPPAPPAVHKVDPVRVVSETVEPKRYFVVGEPKQPEKKLVTRIQKSKDFKLEFQKPSSNFTSTVSSNSNTINSVRKVSQNPNPVGYKLYSPRDPKLTFTPFNATKIPKPSHKTTPSEIHFGLPHHNKVNLTPPLPRATVEQPNKYLLKQGGHPQVLNLVPAATSKDLNRFWSPARGISKQKMLPQRLVVQNQTVKGLKNNYEKLSTETKSTVSGNIKIEAIPKTITFNYLKGIKGSVKNQTK